MWKPLIPIVIAGQTLSDEEAWRHEFRDELHEQCEGAIDCDLLTMICDVIYPLADNDDPRYIARLAQALLIFERPEFTEGTRKARAHLPRTAAPRAMRCTCCRRPRR